MQQSEIPCESDYSNHRLYHPFPSFSPPSPFTSTSTVWPADPWAPSKNDQPWAFGPSYRSASSHPVTGYASDTHYEICYDSPRTLDQSVTTGSPTQELLSPPAEPMDAAELSDHEHLSLVHSGSSSSFQDGLSFRPGFLQSSVSRHHGISPHQIQRQPDMIPSVMDDEDEYDPSDFQTDASPSYPEIRDQPVAKLEDDGSNNDDEFGQHDSDYKPSAKSAKPRKRGARISAQSRHHRQRQGSGSSSSTISSKASLSKRQNTKSDQGPAPFRCSFHIYGCTQRFSNKNEWKRHIDTKHMQPFVFYCCVENCGPEKTKSFNRKDLYTQHHIRMHWPSNLDSSKPKMQQDRFKLDLEDTGVYERSRHMVRPLPEKSICGFCGEEMFGWPKRLEHVGKHLESGESDEGEDPELREWALAHSIIRSKSGRSGVYELVDKQKSK